MDRIVDIAEKLKNLTQYRYRVERYHAGLQRLTVVACPILSGQSGENDVYITFIAVGYIQMPTYWESVPFLLGTVEESRAFMESVGLDVVGRIPQLFRAQLQTSQIYVVCRGVEISETLPP